MTEVRKINPIYIIATIANHQLGDISRDEGDLCIVDRETDDAYIGNWLGGIGFIDVEFPKEGVRPLTSFEKSLMELLIENGHYRISRGVLERS